MGSRVRALAPALLAAGLLTACSGGAESPGDAPEPSPAATSAPPSAEASYLPAGDLPDPLSLKQVHGRTIRAEPFADFAVASGTGVWVSGVAPGAVRYDGVSGAVTARSRVPGAVTQALEESAGEVLVPSTRPNVLLRIDATTGAVRARVRLPGSPLVEGIMGADGDTAYVLVDPLEPTIVVIEGEAVADTIAAPDQALGVRAAFGALWVPTGRNTVERYDLDTEEWTSIASGPRPRFFDTGFGALWVMNQGDGSVTRIDGHSDGRSGEPERIPVTGESIGGGDLTVGGGAVWLRTDTAVARIDPRSRAVTHWIDLPPGSGSAAATARGLLITNHDHLAVHLVPLPLAP